MTGFARFGVAAAALGLALAFGTVAVVAQDKEAEIKTRQDTMKRQGKDFKAIQDYVKGQVDQAGAEQAIADLQSIAPKIVTLFPEGTGLDAFPGKTGAKPDIWKEWDKFKTIRWRCKAPRRSSPRRSSPVTNRRSGKSSSIPARMAAAPATAAIARRSRKARPEPSFSGRGQARA